MEILATAWHWPLALTGSCGALVVLYAALFRFRQLGRGGIFLSGVGLLLLTLSSPLDVLAREYLLSAEVIERVIVALCVPLLLVAGLPSQSGDPDSGHGHKLTAWAGWIAGMGVITFWYAAKPFNAALASAPLRMAGHATSLVAGAAFWWPIFRPDKSRRIRPVPAGAWYLLGATMWCSVAGLFLAFTKPNVYDAYVEPKDTLHILDFLRNQLELTRASDQETGGLLFWIGSCTVLLTVVMLMFYRWYEHSKNIGTRTS